MEDLEVQMLTLLKDNWSYGKPLFHRNMRRVEGSIADINVIVAELADASDYNNEGMADCRTVLTVRTRVPCAGTSNEQVEQAKQVKHSVREEVYRILKESERPKGWIWAFVTRRVNGDSFDTPTPTLGEDLQITIAYQRST